eukprot:maker-scaffold156_size297567-snap-gene-1.36 protein:Tk07677 transcript:maker-scaffold156_size297567-snap-gene-1.36-mRNA-1 annotation:"fh1 fh2 domain-containing protein 3-like"
MPFISSFESRRGPGGSSASIAASTTGRSSVFDRFGGRNNSIFERPSTYGSSPASTSNAGSRYRSSTLERPTDGGYTSNRLGNGTSTTSLTTPFGASSNGNSSLSSYSRLDNGDTGLNGSLSTSSTSLANLGGDRQYKPASRSNSRNLFDSLRSTDSGYSTTAASPYSTVQRDGEDRLSAYSKRVSETLARHGALESEAEKRNSIIETDEPQSQSQWRRKLEQEEEEKLRNLTYVISRATSPHLATDRQRRTRITRSTEPVETFQRRSRRARTCNAIAQTQSTLEFGSLASVLRPKATQEFDYYARVKQALADEAQDKFLIRAVEPDVDDTEDDTDYGYEVKKAPMMQLLPGTRPLAVDKSDTKCSSAPQRIPPPIPDKDGVEEESSYEYETDEEEEELEEEEEGSTTHLKPEETYEAKAENVLENEENSDLDYIDEEDDELALVRSPSQRRKRKTFISGTIDIDVLLGNDGGPANGHSDAPMGVYNTSSKRNSMDISNAKCAKEALADDAPWWLKKESALQVSPSKKSLNQIDKLLQDHESENEETEDPTEPTEDPTTTGADETVADEENWDDYEYEEYEDEGEWEYYDEEEEEGANEGEEEETKASSKSEDNSRPQSLPDIRKPWILEGLANFVPHLPPKPIPMSEDEADEDEDQTEADNIDQPTGSGEKEKEQGYNQWLEETAFLQQTANKILEEVVAVGKAKLESEEAEEETPSAAKARLLVQKIQGATGTDLKRILFSLKDFFQNDKALVYDFVQAQGLALLVELGEDEEAHLQNLILRAVGQIMLYVDGMHGVMNNLKAIQFLYNLISSSNPLVSKTAIKLLLVFVEYSEKNSSLLAQAICDADKNVGVIPWTNVTHVLKKEDAEQELCVFALTLINKCLFGIPDQDTFYDQTDYMEELGMEGINENLSLWEETTDTMMQQIQLYNVAIKQEDGEPVTEDEISYLDEETSESCLRTALRIKSEVVSSTFLGRKSLRFKTRKIANVEVDSTGDIAGVSVKDLEKILKRHGLPISPSGDRLNALELNGFLEKARSIFVTKIAKGEEEELARIEREKEEEEAAIQREGLLRWEAILASFDRPLIICDLDFTDLHDDEEETEGQAKTSDGTIPAPPPIPPPPMFGIPPPPPPVPPSLNPPPMPVPPPMGEDGKPKLVSKKHKKTVKLFWKEIRDSPMLALHGTKTVWDEIDRAEIDNAMIEYLFENRGRDVIVKENKQLMNISREIVVLDHKRSNAINIGMTKLPPPRIIKSAVIKMDSTIMNREGVEKLLTMLPSEEEVSRIQEATEAQPDIPLGTAEQFLVTLASISGLEARLRLWAFKMEFECTEKEVCEPLMDLKIGLEHIQTNATFRTILSVLLTIGNFLNSSQSKGFQLEYLSKVPEVKDTIHKHSLLYHMTYWVLENYPNSSDLYSEIGPITRASRTDFGELERTLGRMESECKLAWDYLKVVSKQDTTNDIEQTMKIRMSDFLNDAAQRIIVMNTVYKKVMKRYTQFLQWMGILPYLQSDYKANQTCKVLSEFSLEYRTTRERVIQTIQKKKAEREKKKVVAKVAPAPKQDVISAAINALAPPEAHRLRSTHQHKRRSREESEDSELKKILGNDIDFTENGTLRRKKKSSHHRHKRDSGVPEELNGEVETDLAKELSERRDRREKKTRRHRSSLLEGTLPMTEESLKNFTGTEMERGLLETLMGVPDEGTLKRNKERRRSIKEKRRSTSELKRSRTRENNVYDAVMEEEQAQSLVHPHLHPESLSDECHLVGAIFSGEEFLSLLLFGIALEIHVLIGCGGMSLVGVSVVLGGFAIGSGRGGSIVVIGVAGGHSNVHARNPGHDLVYAGGSQPPDSRCGTVRLWFQMAAWNARNASPRPGGVASVWSVEELSHLASSRGNL